MAFQPDMGCGCADVSQESWEGVVRATVPRHWRVWVAGSTLTFLLCPILGDLCWPPAHPVAHRTVPRKPHI